MAVELDTENLHPATVLMIEALHWLHERYAAENVLDMGCGGGVLSALSASIWDARVLAADISPKAVEDTSMNIASHGLDGRVTVVQSDGFLSPEIAARTP
ncbi:MAG: 50S ribosomal protein L11 methyltransferase, partial [Pseudomonadota bacterium]|nr:50S ribosomal protein L11 methyltransferase [Pseudomonadota bacterium]